jgi:hypothetical protein
LEAPAATGASFFCPAIVSNLSCRLGMATAALAVAVLVSLVLRNEHRRRGGGGASADARFYK